MRFYLLIATVPLMVYIGYRKYLEPRKWTGTLVVLVLIFLPNSYMEYKWQVMEHKANDVAIMVAGKGAGHLHCQRLSETLLFAGSETGHIVTQPNGKLVGMLTYQLCHDFKNWLASDKTKVNTSIATNIHVIVHESVHLTHEFDEAKTECKAMALDVKVYEMLGASPTVAQALEKTYHDQVYPTLTPTYNNLKC